MNESAFGTPAEANLVDALRDQARPIVSLVGEDTGADEGADDGIIVGHIMFSPYRSPAIPR